MNRILLIAFSFVFSFSLLAQDRYHAFDPVAHDSLIVDVDDSTGAYTVDEKRFILRDAHGVLDSAIANDFTSGNRSIVKMTYRKGHKKGFLEYVEKLNGTIDTLKSYTIVYNVNWQDSVRYDSTYRNGTFRPQFREEFVYRSDGKLDSMKAFLPDSSWILYYEKYSRDAVGKLLEIFGYNSNFQGGFMRTHKTTYTYDSNGRLATIMDWRPIGPSSFQRHNEWTFAFNANDEVTEYTITRIESNNARRFLSRAKYLKTNNFALAESKRLPLQLYPNPVKDVLHFEKKIRGELKIFTRNGQLVKHMPIKSAYIEVNDLLPGTYLVQVKDRGNIYSAPFVKH